MVFHGEKCRHCRANMSEPKLMTEGPKKDWFRSYCISCGHIEFKPPMAGGGGQQQQQPQQHQQMQQQQHQLRPGFVPEPRKVNPFQPVLIKKPPTY